MSGFTKEIIARTFTELLEEKSMAKITVKDIVERCGVNRNTFYYHFRDKYDIMHWIFEQQVAASGMRFWKRHRRKRQSWSVWRRWLL